MSATELTTISSKYAKASRNQASDMSLNEYLAHCKDDHSYYANPWERLLKAIGTPEIVDTGKEERLGRIFQNQKIAVYPNLGREFYGMEDTIVRIVNFLRSAAQGMEESRQILYLLGPVGGGKSSLATRLISLMEREPFYALAYQEKEGGKLEISPFNDDPLSLFDKEEDGPGLKENYGITPFYLQTAPASPWLLKRLDEAGGDLSKFRVVKRYPSVARQVAISRVEPADPNNQDVSALVGKVDIHKMDRYVQSDIDAYSPSGALCLGNRGVMEFVEMFKAPLPVLNPLLTCTQESRYNGTEAVGALPWQGLIIAHSNESEWQKFKSEKSNEAILARVVTIKVPYCLRASEEVKIYEKILRGTSDLADKPIAPKTLEILAKLSVLSRLKPHGNSSIFTKMRVYDGENLKETDKEAKSMDEYKKAAGVDEGMTGIDTRFAFKVLSDVFNQNAAAGGEIAADPVRLMRMLDQHLKEADLPKATLDKYIGLLGDIETSYREYIGNQIQKAFLDSYHDYGQNVFDRYVVYAEAWLDDKDYPDPQTGLVVDRAALEKELEKIEKPYGVTDPKGFRNDIVRFVARKEKEGIKVDWTTNEKMKKVIEKEVFTGMDKILPVISFGAKANKEDEKKHNDFVARMEQDNYTPTQVRTIVDWHIKGLKK